MFSSHHGPRYYSIVLHPFWVLVLRASGLTETAGLASDVVNNIENMKDWSASEEAFEQPDRFDLAFRSGGRKAVITTILSD